MTEDKSRVKSDQYIQFIHMIEHIAIKRRRRQSIDKNKLQINKQNKRTGEAHANWHKNSFSEIRSRKFFLRLSTNSSRVGRLSAL